jgi:hypothetical protein
VKLSDPGATAIIGAGAALAGVLLSGVTALVIDSRRRKWEDRRRWDDPRRRAYSNFLYAARNAFGAADRAAEVLIQGARLTERFEALKELKARLEDSLGGVEAGAALAGARALTREAEALIKDARSFFGRAEITNNAQMDEWMRLFGEAAAEIDVIGSPPVQEAVNAHVNLIQWFVGSQGERESWTTEQIRRRRAEMRDRWGKATAEFQQTVAKELQLESYRLGWQVWKR